MTKILTNLVTIVWLLIQIAFFMVAHVVLFPFLWLRRNTPFWFFHFVVYFILANLGLYLMCIHLEGFGDPVMWAKQFVGLMVLLVAGHWLLRR